MYTLGKKWMHLFKMDALIKKKWMYLYKMDALVKKWMH